jgi:CheY-like chemotaxis protein
MLILYVEDDVDDQLLFREALKKVDPGVESLFARDGEDALKVLNELTVLPDFIFVDLNMPNMDGKQFLKEIRRSEYKDIPVIILTTSTNTKDKIETEKLGAKTFYTKPIRFVELVNILKTALALK